MKLPKRIKIGYQDYTVTFEPQEHLAGNFGHIDYTGRRIRMAHEQGAHEQAATLLHEILHGVARNFSVPVGDNEEAIVSAFELGLACVMRDNPAVFREIVKALEKAT